MALSLLITPIHNQLKTMGLFDSIAKQALGSVLGNQSEGGADLGALFSALTGNGSQATDAMSGLFEQVGGLEGLKSRFEASGVGDIFSSWVGTGQNQSVEAVHVEQVLGADAIQGVAQRFGLNGNQILPLLAQFLPVIIDKLTPGGQIDQNHPSSDQLQDVIASVMKNGLGGLFGGR